MTYREKTRTSQKTLAKDRWIAASKRKWLLFSPISCENAKIKRPSEKETSRIASTMAIPRSKKAILRDIECLCEELAKRITIDDSNNTRQTDARSRYTGDRVRITVNGSYSGLEGTITGPRGQSDDPTYYYIMLDNGTEIYKMPTSWRTITTNN